jgi:hypothetical protein
VFIMIAIYVTVVELVTFGNIFLMLLMLHLTTHTHGYIYIQIMYVCVHI